MQKYVDIDEHALRRCRSRAVMTYDRAAFVLHTIADRLAERLGLFRLQPTCILDVGAATGYTTALLRKQYPAASIYGIDLSFELLRRANDTRFSEKTHWVTASFSKLPFLSHSVDLIFANLIQPLPNFVVLLQEWQRVLKPEGLLLFTTLGVDSCQELRHSFLTIDHDPHMQTFIDMHDLGDLLGQLHYVDPVMDMEYMTVHYASLDNVWRELKGAGITNGVTSRAKGLMGKQKWQKLCRQYDTYRTPTGQFPMTLEIIYVHAFGKAMLDAQSIDEIRIPISHLSKKAS